MIERIADLPQIVWIAAVVLYVIDVARRVTPGEMVLLERSEGRFSPVLARVPFEFRGGELYIVGLLKPWSALLVCRWAAGGQAGVTEIVRRLDHVLGLRIVATINLVSIALVGPIITAVAGIGAAFLVVVPVVYILNIGAGALVIARHTALGIEKSRAVWLMLDAVLCAPYGANWVKRVGHSWPIVAWSSAQALLNEEDKLSIQAVVAHRNEVLEEQQ